jgi:hypothetical protein
MAVCLAFGAGSIAATAQMAMSRMDSGPAVGTIAAPPRAMDSLLSLIEIQVMAAVKVMPAEKYSFRPSAAIFVPGQTTRFDGARTFAQQATHVAKENYFYFGIVSGLKPDVDVSGIEKLTGKEDVVAALAGSFALAHKAVATLTAANAFEVIKSPEPGFLTRATLAEFGIAHAKDHYGQMMDYLRMNGIVPPASAK